MNNYGFAHLKPEGCHIHPDDTMYNITTDDAYKEQLRHCVAEQGSEQMLTQYCSRPEILQEILQETKHV